MSDCFALFIQIGETIACKAEGKALPAIRVEEPTVKMAFSINTSPFVGREVSCMKKLTFGTQSLSLPLHLLEIQQ